MPAVSTNESTAAAFDSTVEAFVRLKYNNFDRGKGRGRGRTRKGVF
jgi:hypothetical protein